MCLGGWSSRAAGSPCKVSVRELRGLSSRLGWTVSRCQQSTAKLKTVCVCPVCHTAVTARRYFSTPSRFPKCSIKKGNAIECSDHAANLKGSCTVLCVFLLFFYYAVCVVCSVPLPFPIYGCMFDTLAVHFCTGGLSFACFGRRSPTFE